jgi:hypothetical protein
MRQRVGHLATIGGLCAILLAAIAGVALPPAAQAQERERCFEQTGYCIRGAILDYWQQHGGLEVFGYPISDMRLETIEGTWTGPVQWFERDRLEDHGIDGVLAGRLGAYYLEQQQYRWWAEENRETVVKDNCVYFEETGHNLCEPFLSQWQNNDGLRRFGYPLTGAFVAQVGDWEGLVQYFERRRMEHHPEFAGTPSEILLGNLGRSVLSIFGAPAACTTSVAPELRNSFQRVPFRQQMGCPEQVYRDVPTTTQPFEHGTVLRADLDGETMAFAVSTMPGLFQRSIPDPGAGGEIPAVLGQATAPQSAELATVQRFAHGWLLKMHTADTVYALGPDTTNLTIITHPEFRVGAPRLGGELVVQTHSVDFYRLAGGLTPTEIRAISSAVEESIASGSTMMGSNLEGRVSVRFEPAQTGICAIRGLTFSNDRTIRMFYNPGANLRNIEAILAHEFIHQLQHDFYGVPAHLRSDIILLEGMAMWGSSPYYLNEAGEPRYHANSLRAVEEDLLLPLTTSLEADCRTTTRNFIYDQWASFVEYLLVAYGRERFNEVYASSNGRPAGSSNYQAVYGKSLGELEAEWLEWLVSR